MTPARQRLAAPADPGEDELARHWSLTASDMAEIIRCRGDDHRRRFALQLCMLRAHGRFLDDYRRAPIKIVNHLSRQLNLRDLVFSQVLCVVGRAWVGIAAGLGHAQTLDFAMGTCPFKSAR